MKLQKPSYCTWVDLLVMLCYFTGKLFNTNTGLFYQLDQNDYGLRIGWKISGALSPPVLLPVVNLRTV